MPIDPNMRLHSEVPLVALPGLVHLRIARLSGLFGRGRKCNNRAVDGGPLTELEFALLRKRVDFRQDRLAEVMDSEQFSKMKQGRGVWDGFQAQMNAYEDPHGHTFADGFLQEFVGESVPLLEKVDAQHAVDPNRGASSIALKVNGLDDGDQPRPRHHRFHFVQELFPKRPFLSGEKLTPKETKLALHRCSLAYRQFKSHSRDSFVESYN